MMKSTGEHRSYLGDGVFVEEAGSLYPPSTLKLTTSNGIIDTNTIYLEPEVLTEFVLYVQHRDRRILNRARKDDSPGGFDGPTGAD